MGEENALISSNGTVMRTIGSEADGADAAAEDGARWLCAHVEEFRNSLVMTFDKVGPDGEDTRGSLVVEQMEELHGEHRAVDEGE